ncbi:UNVERIFIED_CONTAM: hypothetical protein RMT77_012704 [Armadillidium vulgare]
MSILAHLTAKRKFLRTDVTTEFNKWEYNILTSQTEIQRIKSKFEKFCERFRSPGCGNIISKIYWKV